MLKGFFFKANPHFSTAYLELGRPFESELLVEVDVHRPVSVVGRHGLEGDVGADQANVDPQPTVNLFVGERAVSAGNLSLGSVPPIGAGPNCKKAPNYINPTLNA